MQTGLKQLLIILFIGFLGKVVSQVPEIPFRHLDFSDGLPEYGIPSHMAQDSLGRLFISYDRGLYRYDGYEFFAYPSVPSDSTTLSEANVHALYAEGDSLWVGTRNMGICVLDIKTDKFRRILPIEEGGEFPVRRIWSIHRDEMGDLWFGGYRGIVRYNQKNQEYTHHLVSFNDWSESDLEFLNTFRELQPDPVDDNIIWCSTRGGLVAFNKRSQLFELHDMPFSSFEVGLDSRRYLLTNAEFLSSEDIWFSSWAGGILHYNTRTGSWEQFRNPAIDDPRNEVVVRLLKRNSSQLWLSGHYGFGIFNTDTKQFHLYPTTETSRIGVKHSHHYGPFFFTKDSTLFVTGTLGVSVSDPYPGWSGEEEVFPPIISRVNIKGKPILQDTIISLTNKIVLDKEENDISFTLAWPVFTELDKVRFRFWLVGHDKEWIELGGNRIVQYTNLSPGSYEVKFSASKDGKDWIEGRTSPEISIHLPFWQSAFFIVPAGLLIFLGLASIYRMQINHIRQRDKLKFEFQRKLAENEMTALRAQMNPHFMFNSLNSIKNYILKENTAQASKYLTKFSQLMRAILRNSRNKMISLEDELEALRLYLEMESMRFNEEFQYKIDLDPNLELSKIYIPPLLIQPYVENAIWHGLMLKDGDRSLHLEVSALNGQLCIRINDNGIGRKQAAELKRKGTRNKKSYGMQITLDRIELIRKTIGIEANVEVKDLFTIEGKAAGTEVIIALPRITAEQYQEMEDEIITGDNESNISR